jgi:hypothetical protein
VQASNIAAILTRVADPSVIGFQYVPLVAAAFHFYRPLCLRSVKPKNIYLFITVK